MSQTILFLCPHNAAKSVMAAVYFLQLAQQHGLDWQAVSAGTEPSAAVSPVVAALLQTEGIDVSNYRPRATTHEELSAVSRIISMGCDLEGQGLPVTYWYDVPPASEDVSATREVILTHLQQLVEELV